MKTRDLVTYCASRPAAVEDHPWGASPTVFKVGRLIGQRFAFSAEDFFQPPERCGSMLRAGYQRWSEMWRTCG